MGPALLPTPLSPMRGPVETGAWHPAVSRSRTEARGQVRRRRSHRHPKTPSCHLAWQFRGEPLRKPCAKTLDRHFRNRTFLMAGALNFGFASDQGSSTMPPRASDRSARPVMKQHALVRHRLPKAADRSPCIRPSRDRRGQVSPRLSGLDLSSNFRPFGLPSPGVSAPFRWVKSALRVPFLQAPPARLIHRTPFSLWTRVDNSTVRRKRSGRCSQIETILPTSWLLRGAVALRQ